MATEKLLNTRIRLKYDSFADWQSHNPTLLEGEIAIAHLASSHTTTSPDNGSHPVMFKVGPGKFNDLPWASALAADVYAWAKAADVKRVGKNLQFVDAAGTVIKTVAFDYITDSEAQAKINAALEAYSTTAQMNAAIKVETDRATGVENGLNTRLQAVETAIGENGSVATQIDNAIKALDSSKSQTAGADGLALSVTLTDGKVTALSGSIAANTYDAYGAAAAVNSALESYKTTNNAAVAAAAEKGQQGIDDAAAALAEAQKKTTMAEVEAKDYATKTEAQGYANAKDGAIAEAKASGDKAQEDLGKYIESNNAAVALKASQAALEAEISRAQAAEKANSDAIALLVDSTEGDSTKLNSIKELATWIEEHGEDAAEMAGAIEDNAKAIEAEAKRADAAEKANAAAIAALGIVDGKVASAAMADKANSLTDAAKAEVKAVKVDNAVNADIANSLTANAKAEVKAVKVDNAANADKLGGVAAADYATKVYADQAEADAIAAANANTAEVIKNYYTKSEADAAFMDSTETGAAIDAKITALNLSATYEPIGAENRAKAYADGLADNYATAAQGGKADSAVQTITPGTGLTATKSGTDVAIGFDDTVVFIFNCGTANTVI